LPPGFSPDPVLSGICVAQTVKGIQDSGVIATTKHYIGPYSLQEYFGPLEADKNTGNEQEHFRSNGAYNVSR